eukprot:scaffold15967_cov146-Skeletonema_marinoi.AAC.1
MSSANPANKSIPDTNQRIPANGALQTPLRSGGSVSRIGTIGGNVDSPTSTSAYHRQHPPRHAGLPAGLLPCSLLRGLMVRFFHMPLH